MYTSQLLDGCIDGLLVEKPGGKGSSYMYIERDILHRCSVMSLYELQLIDMAQVSKQCRMPMGTSGPDRHSAREAIRRQRCPPWMQLARTAPAC